MTVWHGENSQKLFYDTFRDMKFGSEVALRKWTTKTEKWWAEAMGHSVRVYVIRKKRPARKVNMHPVLEATCKVMGVGLAEVVSSSRRRIYVDVRRMTCMILIDAHYTPLEIEKQLPFKNRIVYKYREQMEDRLTIEPGFERQYEDIKKQVMELSFKTKP